MTDSKENKLELDQFEVVSGGFKQETDELEEFIRKNDPDYKIDNDSDIMRWLKNKSGIGFKYMLLTDQNAFNEFKLSNGRTIYHESLMSMLNERF